MTRDRHHAPDADRAAADRPGPTRGANDDVAKGHAAVSNMTLPDDLKSPDHETIYDAIIAAGKQQRLELRPEIARFLADPTPFLREAALKTLGFYWGLSEYRPQYLDALASAGDIDVRIAAVMALGETVHAPEDVAPLLETALNSDEDEWLRDAAYAAALFAAGIPRRDFPIVDRVPGFEANADWRLLRQLLQTKGTSIPDRLNALADAQRE